ncbi:MAG: chaperone NapD [Pseudomonadota bacterium]|nr:chaperone NapD [Pseudomonadota bacterium]
MSILGIVVRTLPPRLAALRERLAHTPGVDLGPDPGDGRLVAVIESTADEPAAAIMAAIARWPEVHNLSLVYEHSDADPDTPNAFDFRAWRQNVGEFARSQGTGPHSNVPTSAAQGTGEAR